MAIDFGASFNASRYYSVDMSTPLVLPDGDWCIGAWISLPRGLDTAALLQYPYSINDIPGAPSQVNPFFGELESNISREQWVRMSTDGDSGDAFSTQVAGNIGDASGVDTRDALLIVQRNGLNWEMYLVWEDEVVATPTSIVVAGTSTTITINTLYLGGRVDLQTERFFQNPLSEYFIIDSALSNAQVLAMVADRSPITDFEPSPLLYFPMVRPDAVLTDESGNGRNATRIGTDFKYYPHPTRNTFGGFVDKFERPDSASVGNGWAPIYPLQTVYSIENDNLHADGQSNFGRGLLAPQASAIDNGEVYCETTFGTDSAPQLWSRYSGVGTAADRYIVGFYHTGFQTVYIAEGTGDGGFVNSFLGTSISLTIGTRYGIRLVIDGTDAYTEIINPTNGSVIATSPTYTLLEALNAGVSGVSSFDSGADIDYHMFAAIRDGVPAPIYYNETDSYIGNARVELTGKNFGANEGVVTISPTDDPKDLNAVEQTVTLWSDTSITINGDMPVGVTSGYVFVADDIGNANSAGLLINQVNAAVASDAIGAGSGVLIPGNQGIGIAISSDAVGAGSGIVIVPGNGIAIASDAVGDGTGIIAIPGTGIAIASDAVGAGLGFIVIGGIGNAIASDAIAFGDGREEIVLPTSGRTGVVQATVRYAKVPL